MKKFFSRLNKTFFFATAVIVLLVANPVLASTTTNIPGANPIATGTGNSSNASTPGDGSATTNPTSTPSTSNTIPATIAAPGANNSSPGTSALTGLGTAALVGLSAAGVYNDGGNNESDNDLPECALEHPFSDTGTINGCFADLSYGIYYLTAWIAGLFGELFDFFIGYSLSSATYGYPFVVTGWDLVRDISNIFFIIIMVWTGFSAVFDTEKTSMKKVVPNLIVNALLINFSLFATRVVIDISNVTARIFYSEMVVCQQSGEVNGVCQPGQYETGLGGYWPLSEKIVSSFNPQLMFQKSILTPPTTSTDGVQNITQAAANTIQQTDSERDKANYFMVVSLIAAVLMVGLGVMFFKVAFLFVGRVVGLYICMIFSPFAFLSREIPMLGGIERLRWSDWLKELTSYAMLAPVFVFFLYIIYTFLSSNFVQQIGIQVTQNSGFFEIVMSIVIPMLIIYFLLKAAQDAAEKLSGEIGRTIQKYGEQITGLAAGAAIGVATGGASLAGTQFGSRATKAIGEKTGLTQWAAANADNNRFARWTNNSLSKSQTGSWDVRKTKVGGLLKDNPLFTQLGITKNVGKYAGLGESLTEGGIKGQRERRQKQHEEDIKNIKYDHLSPEEAKIAWERNEEKEVEKKALKAYAEETSPAYKQTTETLKTTQDDLKKKQKEIDDIKKDMKVQKDTLTEKEKTEKTETIATKEKEVANLQETVKKTKEEQAKALTTVTTTGYRDTTEYKKKKDEAREKQKDEDYQKYGEIKDQKTFAEAMQRKYSEDLRQNSIWMKDGEQRAGMWILDPITAAIKFEQETLDAATNDFNKKFAKSHGLKESKTAQLTKKIKDFNKVVKDSIASTLSDAEFDEMTLDKKKEDFKNHVDALQDDFSTISGDHDRAKKAYEKKTSPTQADKDALKNSAKIKREAEDKLNKAKNLWDNMEKAQEDLQKEVDKAAAAADKK
jgi:hypothetical protein